MTIATSTGRCILLAGMMFTLEGCHLGRATRSDPQYLRTNHAGSTTLSSAQAPKELFARIATDARACYVGGAIDMVMPAGPGIFVPVSGPGRDVEAKFDDAAGNGIVRGFVDGNIYLPMFQIDISGAEHGSRLDVYYAKDLAMHRAVPENLKAWLAGDDAACSFDFPKNH